MSFVLTVREAFERYRKGERLPAKTSFHQKSKYTVVQASRAPGLYAVTINTLGRTVYLPAHARLIVEDE